MPKKKTNNEELIHVKFDYDELMQSKKEFLSLEMSLLKILRTLKTFHALRDEELKRKITLQEQMKNFDKSMKNLKTELPKLKIPKILKHEYPETEIKHEKLDRKKIHTQSHDSSLESELREIQEELRKLQ